MSDAPHVIRLRGAWSVTTDGPRFRHARPFGWPAALDPHERVWLVVLDACGSAVAVNGAQLGGWLDGARRFEADITSLLRPRNELVLTGDTDRAPVEVTLEVRRADSAPG